MSYSGIIVAGGKSSRMGQDKALMELEGTPMIQRIAAALHAFTNEIIIASNNSEHYAFGDRGVADNYIDSGPLSGIEAGLSVAKNDSCFVISCDTPMINGSILSALMKGNNTDATIARCGDKAHPLIGIYHRSSLQEIQGHLEKRDLKMMNVLDQLNTTFIDFPISEQEAFQNINTPSAWNQLTGK